MVEIVEIVCSRQPVKCMLLEYDDVNAEVDLVNVFLSICWESDVGNGDVLAMKCDNLRIENMERECSFIFWFLCFALQYVVCVGYLSLNFEFVWPYLST